MRREKVILEVEDHATNPLLRAAGAAKTLDKSLDDVDGSLARNAVTTNKTTAAMRDGSREIDRYSGRFRVLADVAAILGPGMVPIAAIAVPAVTALAAQLGAAALAGGTAIVAFQGVGDALKAANKAALEPTAANLEEARLAMGRLGPEAREFVTQAREMVPALQGIRNAAAAGLFPGVTRSLDEMDVVLPQIEDIVYRIGDAVGDLADDTATALAGPEWADFLGFLENEIPAALTQLGHTTGNLAHGLAELWMAFDPVNDDVAGWLLNASAGFDDWARGLSQTEGFEDFVAYLRENGPRVADALGSIGSALIEIVEAAAPLGGPVLGALTAVADVIASIADSDAGPAIMGTVTALALLNRSMRAFDAVSGTTWYKAAKGADGFTAKVTAARTPLLRGAGVLTGFGIAASGAADGIGLSNTASMALLGTLGGPWGAAVGAAIGLTLDMADAQGGFEISADSLSATLDQQTGAITRNTSAYVANELEKQGILRSAQDLGLNLDDVTRAALGNEGAMRRVTSALSAADAAFFDSNGRVKVSTDTLFDFREKAEAVKGAIGATSGELDNAKGSLQRVAAATRRTAEGFDQGTSAAQRFRDAVERVNAVLSRRASFRDYEQALDDFANTLDKVKNKANILTKGGKIDIKVDKGREVQAALDNIAQSAIKVAENLRGADRVEFLKRARKDFLDVAAKLLGNQRAARDLAVELGLLDKKRANPKVNVDTGSAYSDIANIHRALNNIPDETVFVNVQRRGGQTPGYGPQAAGYAGGGFTGWGGVSEPAGVVHGREFVFDAVSTARAGVENLYALQRQLRGYAGGGYVEAGGRSSHTSTSERVVVERIVERLASKVTIQLDNGKQLTGFVRGVASDVVNGHQTKRRNARGYGDD